MKVFSGLFVCGLLAQTPWASAWSQGTEGEEPIRCIGLSRIDHTTVIDNQSIAFFLKGGDIYVNRLGRACNGLERNQPFSYRTSTGQLCSVDVITLLEDFGFGLSRGASCGLGEFHPTDEEEVEELLHPVEGDRPEVTVEPVDVPEQDSTR